MNLNNWRRIRVDYVLSFIKKVCDESPNEVEFSISNMNFLFKKVKTGNAKSALIRYEGMSSEDQKIIFEFQHVHISNTNFNRLELKVPGRSGQITCFHFGQLGFVSGEPIIDITQTIKLSGRDKEANKIKKQLAVNLLSLEGLLDSNNENRWYLGTFNNKKQEWLDGKDTKSFICDFLKLGVIMAYVRGDTGIKLHSTIKDFC